MTDAVKFRAPGSLVYVPSAMPALLALNETTHLGIGAHPDDLEIFGFHGILAGRMPGQAFTGVTLGDGAGGPRAEHLLELSDAEIASVRREEQMAAADLGAYSAQVFLNYPSSIVRDLREPGPSLDLEQVLSLTQPDVVYTHALSDRHATHVAVTERVVESILRLEPNARPQKLLGCEVWGDLDWLPAAYRVELDVSAEPALAQTLIEAFHSQLSANKRYGLASLGRRAAHATFGRSDAADAALGVTLAMDLTPLIQPGGPKPEVLLDEMLEAFRAETLARRSALVLSRKTATLSEK